MKNTSNLNLGQPLVTEYYDINVQNDNMDIIDTAYKNLSDDISDLTTNVDTLQTANNDMSETLSNLSTDVQTLHSVAIS
ncbi:MAG: hypothetical protein LUD73_05555, partial [Lachnospiraceae bacterium]|nr:hypothetical protein [Lachnospiraceae bacterium]